MDEVRTEIEVSEDQLSAVAGGASHTIVPSARAYCPTGVGSLQVGAFIPPTSPMGTKEPQP